MTNDISVYGLNVVAPVARKDSAGSIKQMQAKTADQASPSEGLASASAQAARRPGQEELAQSVDDLNTLVQELHRELRFSVDDDSGQMIVKVVDRKTDEVLRQIPAEDVLRLRERLEEATGAIFSDRV